jgi:hypothetical protein
MRRSNRHLPYCQGKGINPAVHGGRPGVWHLTQCFNRKAAMSHKRSRRGCRERRLGVSIHSFDAEQQHRLWRCSSEPGRWHPGAFQLLLLNDVLIMLLQTVGRSQTPVSDRSCWIAVYQPPYQSFIFILATFHVLHSAQSNHLNEVCHQGQPCYADQLVGHEEPCTIACWQSRILATNRSAKRLGASSSLHRQCGHAELVSMHRVVDSRSGKALLSRCESVTERFTVML